MRGKQGKGFIERVWGGSDMQGSGVFGGFRGIWEVSSEHIIADEAADDGEPVAKKSSLS